MLKFISLGSGSSGNCYLLYTETDGLLIDAGISFRMLGKRLGDCGLTTAHIRHIVVTHRHTDHAKHVGQVSNKLGIDVSTTQEVHHGIYTNYCVQPKVAYDRQQILPLEAKTQLGAFTVEPFRVPHDSMDCVGYEIEADGKTFCLVTDAGEITTDIIPHIAHAQHLVIEANHDEQTLMNGNYPPHLKQRILSPIGHLSNANCAAAIVNHATERLQNVWLCHLSEENNHPDLALQTVKDAVTGAPHLRHVHVAVLRRTAVSGPFDLL